MNYIRQYAPQSSLRIYEPVNREIDDGFFSSEHHQQQQQQQMQSKVDSPMRAYQRQDSLIDQLQYKEQSSRRNSSTGERLSNNFPKSTSIQLMVEQQGKRNIGKREYINLQEMMASRPELLSKEISSAILKGMSNPLFQVNQRYSLQESLNNSKSAIPSPQKEGPDPERPNLARPFLRKKATSKESSFESSENLGKIDEALSIERNRLEISISTLKEYNSHLMPVYRSLQSLHSYGEDWRSLESKEIDLLKLMIEKAIISKQVR